MDRLRTLTHPRVDDVADGLAQYRETKQRIGDLIGEIVEESVQ